ncbi:acyl-CoA dehydrogenase family protein [Brevibacterium sp. 50QC2O2]|uniref:acyl-CoA dehydrogenase family protein n=1 Tax=Brevibacterium sp. 50QC2O2 TaxID=2968459 RepID=UPI00211CC3EA|nr:acyl-CoA dehydrogenase family protein [Brevibacterium sp. 50QC2O2]
MASTHTVINQSAPRTEIDEYDLNPALREVVAAFAPDADQELLHELGRTVGTAEFQHNADLVNTHTPVFTAHDRWGNRVDQVEFHPAYHAIMAADLGAGGHSHAWAHPGTGANVERAARFHLFAQVEPGHTCPVSMTHAAAASLAGTPHAEFWLPRLYSTDYDPRLADATEKTAVTFGMAMTEKQGGSDVRANTTCAVPVNAAADDGTGFGAVSAGHYLLTGHKWFCSAPQSDAFLMLAQTEEGISCFLVPRFLPRRADGTPGGRNTFNIQKLKDKLGNKSNASSEIELDSTHGWLVGEPGRGVRTIIEMVSRTRLDCIIGSVSGMRQGVAEAAWHARHRAAFGAQLVDQPLMRAVLADLQLEYEAAVWTLGEVAAAYDSADPEAAEFRRLAVAVAKYWICKRGPEHAYESLECLGGNGYTEVWPLARRYREQPVLAVWEGSGNVIALDVLRALTRDPASAKAFLAVLEAARGRAGETGRVYDAGFEQLAGDITDAVATMASGEAQAIAAWQARGRTLVEHMALLLQAAVLLTRAPAGIGEAFVAARLSAERGREYGAFPAAVEPEWIDLLVERA